MIEFMKDFVGCFTGKCQNYHREQVRLAEMGSGDLAPSASTRRLFRIVNAALRL